MNLHKRDCPRPSYRGTEAQDMEWQAQRLQLRAIQRRQARYAHLCALFGVQDRDEPEASYTAQDWRECIERTNDEAERRMRE